MSESIAREEELRIEGEMPKRSWLRRVFFGADGLRAGWSLVVFYALVTVMEEAVKAVFHARHWLDPDQLRSGARYPSDLLITNGIPFVVVALAAWLTSRIERRPFRVYGYGRTPGAARQFGVGIFWGVALLSVLVLALWGTHVLVFDGVALGGADAVRYGLEWGVGFLCVGLFEEAVTRGFLFYTLARGIAGPLRFTGLKGQARTIGFWTVAVLTAVLFGLGHSHNHGESTVGLVVAGLIGFAFTLALWRTGSLWWAIGMHTGWDWAQSYLYGTADSGHVVTFHLLNEHPQGSALLSGGLTGPEGSVYAVPVVMLSLVVIVWTLRPGGWPVVE